MSNLTHETISRASSELLRQEWHGICFSRKDTFSVSLGAAAAAFEEATAALKVLFGLLFISLAEEEGAEMVPLQPLLALLIATACSDDTDTVICLPGEAKGEWYDYNVTQ